MASRLTAPASSPAKQKHSPKKSKKKIKGENSPSGEATAMGCSPSQAVIVQSSKTENSHLHPTIFMVGEKSLQMLRELGELKFYQLAQYNETENTSERLHHDFAAQLENPLQYLRHEQSRNSGNYQVAERSVCNIRTDYLIRSQKNDPGLSNDGLTDLQESCVGSNNLSGNLPSGSADQITTKYASDSPILLSTNSLGHSKGMDIKITAKNTSSSPILLSGTSPSHSSVKDIKITAPTCDLSHSPTHDRTKTAVTALSPNSLHRELNPKTDASTTISTTSSAADPLDEIVAAPDASCTTPTNEGNMTPKTKMKPLFGRNRVMPKGDVSDKYDVTKSVHETLSRTVDDS